MTSTLINISLAAIISSQAAAAVKLSALAALSPHKLRKGCRYSDCQGPSNDPKECCRDKTCESQSWSNYKWTNLYQDHEDYKDRFSTMYTWPCPNPNNAECYSGGWCFKHPEQPDWDSTFISKEKWYDEYRPTLNFSEKTLDKGPKTKFLEDEGDINDYV